MDLDLIAPDRGALVEQVLKGPGEASPELRIAAAANAGLPPELAALVEKIHRHAYKITDEEMAALRSRYSEDQLFEIVVAAAVGASQHRFLAGLRALEGAK